MQKTETLADLWKCLFAKDLQYVKMCKKVEYIGS